MKLRFYNARYLDTNDMTVKKGTVCTNGERFSYVGSAENAPENEVYGRDIDLKNDLIIPGFCNAHTHSPMVFLRSFAEDLPLDRWLNEAVFPNEAKLLPEDSYTLTKLAVCEYLSGGTTSCFDMYFSAPEQTAKAFIDTGFRGVFCGAVNNFCGSPKLSEEHYVKLNSLSPLISYKLGFHAEYTTSLEIMEQIAALAQKYHAPVWCHNSETKSETEGCISRYGKTPTGLMESIGMFEYGGGGYHCVYFTENDMDIFRRHNMTAVTNPASNSKLASGIADISSLMSHGINVAIGTDGAASNNALDMFREMYLCTVLQKLRYSDAAAMPAENVLRAAILGGAKAMELDCGSIEAGKLADFAVVDMRRPSMQPENDIVKNLVFSGSKDIIRMTAVGGKILYENGSFAGIDTEKLYHDCARICERIFAK